MKSLRGLWGFKIQASDGALGKVQDFLFDDEAWTIRYLVAEIGSWMRSRDILVLPEYLEGVAAGDRVFLVNLDKASLRNGPTIDEDKPVSLQQSLPWQIIYQGPEGFVLTGLSRETLEKTWKRPSGDPHLRSVRELIGYCVYALDGEVGHVKDFLVNDSLYMIAYMCVTIPRPRRNRLRMISVDLIETVSWPETRVVIDATRTAVKNAPTLSPGRSIDRDFEMELLRHYNAARHTR